MDDGSDGRESKYASVGVYTEEDGTAWVCVMWTDGHVYGLAASDARAMAHSLLEAAQQTDDGEGIN